VESPALAATTSCELKNWSLKTKKCTTGAIKANKAHDLRISASLCKGSPYKVWDVNTGKTIASGKGKGQSDGKMIDRVINGLYGTYKAKLSDGCQYDQIWLMDY